MKKKKPLTRSEQMSRIRGKDTSIEIALRKELWSRGLRYRKNCKKVFGCPDIVFLSKKIAVFCDSEFWHGKKYKEGSLPKTNTEYWVQKFERNIKRDRLVNKTLKKNGWVVIRFWAEDIKKDPKKCVDKIEEKLQKVS